MRYLNLQGNTIISNEGVQFMTNIIALNLSCLPRVTSDCLKTFPLISELVIWHNTSIVNEDVMHLTNLTKLNIQNMNNVTYDVKKYLPYLVDTSYFKDVWH